MNTSVIFHGIGALDFEELRINSVRIPEVLSRIKQAEKIWSDAGLPFFDFINFIGSENIRFYANIKFKSLAVAVVQVGLFDRYLKNNQDPHYLIGNKVGDSALMYLSGETTFPELVLSSKAALSMDEGFTIEPTQTLSSGVDVSQLTTYYFKDYKKEILLEGTNQGLSQSTLMRHLIDEHAVSKFINIGPGTSFDSLKLEFNLEDLCFMESVDCDPMLNWFWKHLNPLEFQQAQ